MGKGDSMRLRWRPAADIGIAGSIQFFLIDGKERRVVVQGHGIANDGELVRVWCRNGFGIARKSRLDVEANLRQGALIELLQDFSSGETGLQIVYPATQARSRGSHRFFSS